MIDLHLHLLPAVDDGAASLDVSVAMLDLAAQLGFARLIATPHLDGPLVPAYVAKVRAALESVRVAALERGSPISIDSGYEIRLSPDLPHRLASGERSTLAESQTVLVELPFAGWPNFTEQTLFSVQTLGFTPLLAHPERYTAVQTDIDRALDLVDRGVLLQVTAGSLAGLFGKPAQRTAEQLLTADAIAVLASDAHSNGRRFVSVADGIRRAVALVGEDRVRQLTHDNPAALLDSRPLPAPAPVAAGAEGGWRKVFERVRG
jgi:protein-tyrosine phosphatase